MLGEEWLTSVGLNGNTRSWKLRLHNEWNLASSSAARCSLVVVSEYPMMRG
jgi:hypothetical protein